MTPTQPDGAGPLAPGALVAGRYRLERILGVGGMGSVWLARDRRFDDRLVAVKLVELGSDAARAGRFLQRFSREARLLAGLRHPNLVTVYDVNLSVTPPYLIMEYVEGEDLGLRLARHGPLAADAVRRLLREQAGALACLHEKGVIHRDVKPGNVLLDRDGSSRLTDLGLAFDADATKLTRDDSILGTVVYMAPEILLGEPASPRSDVFALGLLVHEAATGLNPVSPDADWHAYVAAVLSGTLETPPLDPSLPPDLATVLHACLRLDPSGRPADAGAILALMQGPTDDAAHPTPPPPPPPPAPLKVAAPPASPRRLGPALVALAVALPLALLHLHRASRPSPAVLPSPSPPAATAPTVRRGLDLTEIVLPSPLPLPATLRLETDDGDLVVGRTVHDGRLLLPIPRDAAGRDFRWTARLGPSILRGATHGGLRPDFGGDAASTAPDDRRDLPRQPPVVVGDRLALTGGPDVLTLLRPDRSPEASSRLSVEQSIHLVGPPTRAGSHPVAGLGALGRDRLVLIERGRPSGLLVFSLSPEGSLAPAPPSAVPGESVLDALTAPCPDGALAALMASRPLTDGVPGRPRLVVGTLSAETPPRLASLELPGTVPLALGALDGDTLALGFTTPGGPATTMLVTRQGPTFRVLATSTSTMDGPGWWGPHLGLPLVLMPDRGRAVFGARNDLVVMEATGPVRRIPLGLDDTAVVGAVVRLDESRVMVVAACPAVPGISVPTYLHTLVVDTDPQAPPPGPPAFLLQLQANLGSCLPLACIRVGGQIHLFVRDALLELDGAPPFTVRRRRPMDGVLPESAALVDGMVCLLDRRGRIFAYDPVNPD